MRSLREYDFASQQEVFRKMSPDQRYKLWQQRLSEVKPRLNFKELDYLTQIEKLFNLDFFRTTMPKETSEFFFGWMVKVKRDLGWSEFETISLLCTLNPVFITSERGARYVSAVPDDTGKTCVCAWDSYCDVFTQGTDPDCADFGCGTTSLGCGWFLLSGCEGRCHQER
ncbi:MAG: bacteriocin fulvocin C-related protein [Saprospiraceae bacterium]|nr:bacteriocin fulvocin C-related protein [Saprospiraceae bacterium]MDZ4702346.1 bacteriocin fulvocin C-related protein [Saprospiraceae bacterium]